MQTETDGRGFVDLIDAVSQAQNRFDVVRLALLALQEGENPSGSAAINIALSLEEAMDKLECALKQAEREPAALAD